MGFKLAEATNASCMRRSRGELRVRLERAEAEVLVFFLAVVDFRVEDWVAEG